MTAPSLAELRELAVDLAWRAGRVTLKYFQAGVEADTKGDGTPVTVADREAEELLRREIRRRFPDDGLLGEEYGDEAGTSGRTWVVDPIDGTQSFVHGVPLYGVLIGIVVDRRAVAGVVHLPALGETLSAHRGGGCFLNGRRVRVSRLADLSRSLLVSSDMPSAGDAPHVPPSSLLSAVGVRRTWGDCYGYALVASGRAEVMLDPVVNAWDVAAVQPIVEEAGGRLTDLEGEPTIWGGAAVATNGILHDEVLARLAGRRGAG